MRVGLAGFCCPTGLGIQNGRMWRGLPFERWLRVEHPVLKRQGFKETEGPRTITMRNARSIHRFLNGLDAVVSVEKPLPENLFEEAKRRKIRCVLIVNVEWFMPKNHRSEVDRFIVHNRFGEEYLGSVGVGGRTVYCPVPLDLEEIQFQERATANSFMYSDGWGGVAGRKGLGAIRGAMEHLPAGFPLTVFSQRALKDMPENRDVRGAVGHSRDLYEAHDVAIAPSRFEGLGYGVLEPLIAGMPVLTTDAPPMNEYVKDALGRDAEAWLLPAVATQARTWKTWTAWDVDPEALARRLKDLKGEPIQDVSRRVRQYVERVHGQAALDLLWEAITG